MVGIAVFCSSLSICFFCLYLVLLLFANSLVWDKWENLKNNYTDNQKTMLVDISGEMMQIPFTSAKYKNYEEILSFMYSGAPNDDVIDQEEAEILTNLLTENISNQSQWGKYLDVIMQYGRSDNMDNIAKSVYRTNLSDEYKSDGYILAKAISQVNDANDNESEKLISAYEVVTQYANNPTYKTVVSKLANKLMTSNRIDTIATGLNTERESIRDVLIPLT